MKYIAKYPGNPALNTTATTNELMQNVVVYRSADFVLMAAEAYAQANNLDGANKYLEKLLTARIPGYTYTPYASIDEVFAAIKQERLKEMFMEGNRIADLKRWGDAMDRPAGKLAGSNHRPLPQHPRYGLPFRMAYTAVGKNIQPEHLGPIELVING